MIECLKTLIKTFFFADFHSVPCKYNIYYYAYVHGTDWNHKLLDRYLILLWDQLS